MLPGRVPFRETANGLSTLYYCTDSRTTDSYPSERARQITKYGFPETVCVSRFNCGTDDLPGDGGGPAAVKHKQLCLSKSSSGVITRTTNGTFAVTDDGTIALPGKQSDYG